MNIDIFALLILGFYGLIFLGSIILVIWAINNRIKEKKRESKDIERYKKY